MKLITGRKIRHSSKIDLASLNAIEPNRNHRQMLKFSYLDRKPGFITTVILMNPSSADKMMADNTVRRVQDITHHLFNGASEVRVFNLFTLRGKNPKDLNQMYLDGGLKSVLYPGTDEILKDSVEKSKIIIAAWGGPCGINNDLHSLRVQKTIEIIKKKKQIYRIAGGRYSPSSTYPLHGRLWGYSMKPFPFYNRCL